jgi:GT2 family glycosyltransferase
MIDISIIVVSYNTRELTIQCLTSIIKYCTNFNYEIILVDNASSDDSIEYIAKMFPNVMLIENNLNVGFSKANNQGIKRSSGEYIFLLNSDAYLESNAIEILLECAKEEGSGSVLAPRLLNVDGTIQRSYFDFPSTIKITLHSLELTQVAHYFREKLMKIFKINVSSIYQEKSENELHRVPYVLFAAVFMHKEVIRDVGLLDENMNFYHEDCEYGYRLFKSNYNLYLVPKSKIFHIGGGSSKTNSFFAFENYYLGLIYFYKKHKPNYVYLTLKLILFSVFILRSFLTILGFYATLKLPSTYKDKAKAPSFGNIFFRMYFYLKFSIKIIAK